MAKRKPTTTAARAASVAKTTRRDSVEWSPDDPSVVIRATGRMAAELPAGQLDGLRDLLDEMGLIWRAFMTAERLASDGNDHLLLQTVIARRAVFVMQQAQSSFDTAVRLSPHMQAALAIADARRKRVAGNAQ